MVSNRAINPVKLFIGIRTVEDVRLMERLEERLNSEYGPSDHRMILAPSETTIHRVFLSFDRLIEAESLPKIRDLCRSVEKEFSAELVAGFVDNRRVVTEEAAGADGFEERMRFKDGGIQFLPHTPDYLSATSREFFLSMRKTYRVQLRTRCLLRK
jgi:hypothetical protein